MRKVLFFICLLVTSGLFAQQSGIIKGTIVDEEMNGQPMQMANVELKGTSYNVQSNFFGDFEINNIEPGNYEMLISFAGYETVSIPLEVKADGITEIHQSLVAETLNIDEFFELTKTTDENTASVNLEVIKSNKE